MATSMATSIAAIISFLCLCIPGICGFHLPPPHIVVGRGRAQLRHQQFCRDRGLLWRNQGVDDDDDIDGDSLQRKPASSLDSKDDFLDQAFFDPEQVTEDDPAPLQWFANLVKNDYESAEALYVGLVFALLVVLTQEVLRMQLYGANYVPFTSGRSSGTLF